MGTEPSLSSGGDTSEKDPSPTRNEEQSQERVFGSDLMVMDGDFLGLDENKLEMSEILDQIHGKASSILEFSVKWEAIEERYTSLENLLKERAMEIELKEKSVMKRTVELEKKEERLKEVEERERKIGLLEKSMTVRLVEKEKEIDVIQDLVSGVMRLVCEKANEEVTNELEERGKEVERLSKSNDEKSCEFDLKQKESIERRRKEAELVEESLKQLEAREKELSLHDEAVKEKLIELEKKEKIFEAEQNAKSEKIELKSKFLEVKEKKLEEREKELELKQRELEEVTDELEERGKEVERLSKLNDEKSCELEWTVKEFDLNQKESIRRRVKESELVKESLEQLEVREKELSLLDEAIKEKATELEKKEEVFEAEQKAKAEEMELKQRELEERSIQAETCKWSRGKLLAIKVSEADTHIRPAKRHKPLREHIHDDEDMGISEAHEGDVEEFVSIDEDPQPLICSDSEFHDFSKTMSSFVVGKVWALYDPIDEMPRLFGRIKKIIKSRLSLQVTWLEPKDEESVPVACGRFTYGTTETVSHLTFSHELQPIIHGRNFIAVNPRQGETWALFRDWSKSWNNNPEQHRPPYRYDFVEVLFDFEDQRGVGVAYLGKVDGFVSVFEHAEQNGVFQRLINPEEMHIFSHKVPSFRLSGEEKEGVPVGSFELDPAAVPRSILKVDHSICEVAEETERQSNDCGKGREVAQQDVPIIILD